ncbi:uracil phosphoribosyltransferase [Colletotrichum asianum]
MGQFSNAIKAGQTVIELGRNAQGLAGAANEFRTADKGEMGRNVGRAAFNEGADTGKTMGKTWLKTFEVVPRLVCRGLQFLFALIACGFYGNRVQADDKADNGFSPEWILAITVAGAAAVSSVLFVLATPLSAIPFIGSRVKLFKTYRAFAWDLFLFIMWIVVFGIFAGIFLKRSSEDKYKGASTTAMKTAVWVDLVNAILWLISGVYGCIKTFLGDKVDHLSDKAGKKLFEKKKPAPAKDGYAESASPERHAPNAPNPTIVGLCGVPACGKSFLLCQLKAYLGEQHYAFYEGSEVIDDIVLGGLHAFKRMHPDEQYYWRERAITFISRQCRETNRVGVVTGHYSFCDEGESPNRIFTDADSLCYTHIFYLDVPAKDVARQCLEDTSRSRSSMSVEHIEGWIKTSRGKLDSMLVFDADKTLCAADTGNLFWHLDYPESACAECDIDTPLEELFSSEMGYSYKAFRQAMLRYEDIEYKFEVLCDGVASRVFIYPEFLALLHAAEKKSNLGVAVVTCGIRRVWEKILARENLSSVTIIGCGRIADGYVVTPEVKAAVDHHNLYVYAFGDSPMDLPMLKAADEAIVVVGDERLRSKSMDEVLLKAIAEDGLRAKQILMPRTSGMRLSSNLLPVLQLDSQLIVAEFTKTSRNLRVFHATEKAAAKLLMTPTRDASVAGPSLRAAHHEVGRYLAIEFLADGLGVEEHAMPHVQGHITAGHRLLGEQSTAIIAMMRGGEPMALGVSEVFARAMFLHAKQPEDIHENALAGRDTVILVDSVVNSGKSIEGFVRHLQAMCAKIRIAVVAGVVQKDALTKVMKPLGKTADLSLVALRLSENKYVGQGGTNTGNRLFNTTHML